MTGLVAPRGVRAWNFRYEAPPRPSLFRQRITARATIIIGLLVVMLVAGAVSVAARRQTAAIRPAGPLATHNDPPPAPVAVLPTQEIITQEAAYKCIIWAFNTRTWRSRHTFEEHLWKEDLRTVYSISPPGRPPGPFDPSYLQSAKPGDLNFKDPAQRGSGPAEDFPCLQILRAAGFKTGGF